MSIARKCPARRGPSAKESGAASASVTSRVRLIRWRSTVSCSTSPAVSNTAGGACASSAVPPHASTTHEQAVNQEFRSIRFLRSCALTPKGQLRALPAPSHPNGDTSCYQHLHTHRSARRLHPTLYRGPWFRYSVEPGAALRSASYGGNGDLLADRSATVRTLPHRASELDRATEDPL